MTNMGYQRAFAPFRRSLPRSLWLPMRGVVTGVLAPIRFAIKSGHFRSSLTMTARAQDGAPLPWYTYPTIDFLTQRRFNTCNVLEFGGGQSTLWWASRARSVLTIEEDQAWHARLSRQIPENVRLFHVPADDRAHSLGQIRQILDGQTAKKYDVIVVDGHFREELTALAFEYLAPKGAIILDDADGYGFYENTRERNCRRVDFFGFAPGVVLRRCTSIAYVDDCFLFNPDIPIPVIESGTAA